MSISDSEREVFRVHKEEQSKYVYFLLAASGAAIGFAVSQTQGLSITYSQIPLGIAVILWGLSFYFGCNQLAYSLSNLYANAAYFQIQKGNYPDVGSDPNMILAATEGIKSAFESNANKANRSGHLQFIFLIAGSIFFLIWHVLEMYLRSFCIK